MEERFLHLTFEGESISLIAFLHTGALSYLSRKKIKAALEKKACRVNGRLETFASRRLKHLDTVRFDLQKVGRSKPLSVLYDDEYMTAIDKDPFFVVDQLSIERALTAHHYIVHRLDKETSGVLLFAKHEESKNALENLFKMRLIQKTYLAIVEGIPKQKKGVIDLPIYIKDQKQGRKLMDVGRHLDAKAAQTHYEVIHTKGNYAFVKCMPKTGRTHQIRVHLKAIGLSIVGDHIYSLRKRLATERMMLHAESLEFEHPFTGDLVAIKAPLPHDFIEVLGELGLK